MIKYYKLEGMRSIPCTMQEWMESISNSIILANKKDNIVVITYHKGSVDTDIIPLELYRTTAHIYEPDINGQLKQKDAIIRHSSTYEEAETVHRLICEEVGINIEETTNDLFQ